MVRLRWCVSWECFRYGPSRKCSMCFALPAAREHLLTHLNFDVAVSVCVMYRRKGTILNLLQTAAVLPLGYVSCIHICSNISWKCRSITRVDIFYEIQKVSKLFVRRSCPPLQGVMKSGVLLTRFEHLSMCVCAVWNS